MIGIDVVIKQLSGNEGGKGGVAGETLDLNAMCLECTKPTEHLFGTFKKFNSPACNNSLGLDDAFWVFLGGSGVNGNGLQKIGKLSMTSCFGREESNLA